MRRIEIEIPGKGRAIAELDERNPIIAGAFWDALPYEARANLWGEEIYFEFLLPVENENTSSQAISGDISYWLPGHAFCVFFGKTQPYSDVNHFGKIVENLEVFKEIGAGDRIVLWKNQAK